MGRKVTDGRAIDVSAPSSTPIVNGELYRIDNFTGFAMTDISSTDTVRTMALDCTEGVWSVLVPSGTCGTRGMYVKWSNNDGSFKKSSTDITDETVAKTVLSVAKVETVRNSRGYARLKLLIT